MHITLNLNCDFALLTEKTKQKTLAVLIKGSHMCYIFLGGGRVKPMLLSLNSLHFQHEGAHCHVIAGESRPKSVRMIEVPQKRSE